MSGGLEVAIVTVRDIFQDEARRLSRFSDGYRNLSAQIILDKQDLGRLGAKEGDRLLVKNGVGSIVVAARASQDDSHQGLAFMYNSPWSNQLVSDPADQSCIPGFKSIKATVSPAHVSGAAVTEISELFTRMRG
jgi:formylmethanofuran dehydrogenase subunit D